MNRAFLLCTTLISLASPSYVTYSKPTQHWNYGYGQGILEFNLVNPQGSKLIVSCDVGFSDTGKMSSVSLELSKGYNYTPDSSNINIVIDSISHEIPTNFENKNSYRKWNNLILGLQHANHFSVYVNGNLKSKFFPDVNNSPKFLEQVDRCLLRTKQ